MGPKELTINCTVAHPCRNALGEGPIWDWRTGVLWWVDILDSKLWRYQPSTHAVTVWDAPRYPACLALHGAEQLLLTGRNWSACFSPAAGSWQDIATTGIDFSRERFNDGRVDAKGRWWIGAMDRQLKSQIAGVYCLQPGWQWQRQRSGIGLGNGIGFSPDARWMYVTDTLAKTIYRHEFDLQAGRIGPGTAWVSVTAGAGGPDGLTVDSEGFVWSAQFDRAAIHRYSPDGSLVAKIALPVRRPTSVEFGGEGLKTLFITSASMEMSPQDLEAYPMSGNLLSIDCDVSGMPENVLETALAL